MNFKTYTELLTEDLVRFAKENRKVVWVGVGAITIPGDAFGPFIAEIIRHESQGQIVYGGGHDPIHKLNFTTAIKEIRRKHPNDALIAIDAMGLDQFEPGEVVYLPRSVMESLRLYFGGNPDPGFDGLVAGMSWPEKYPNGDVPRRLHNKCINSGWKMIRTAIQRAQKELTLIG